ncbi:Chloramphenicol acetyltransferase-like domain protein [Ascosphaera apis ARSEF 7405]|uniref:Chloramphenicol acetyltransferase-like domain protein n=1 Tax=Ascosphaera apis ARSEF 7405 TaxID=392613 RepID=A0A168C7M1_9EURO|nr:Chloramphenicol acetyltransferase-like domain protein [Ascosphaera apis ARSEF 7405]
MTDRYPPCIEPTVINGLKILSSSASSLTCYRGHPRDSFQILEWDIDRDNMLSRSMTRAATGGSAIAILRPLNFLATALPRLKPPQLHCRSRTHWQHVRPFSAGHSSAKETIRKCPMTSSGLPKLTLLEKIAPPAYVRIIYPFALPENYDINEISHVIRTAHAATNRRIPHMASIVGPTMEDGVLTPELQHRQEGDPEDLVINDLRSPGAFPMTFKELQERHFPIDTLDPEKLCKYNNIWFPPTERHPASFVQANLIQGGMLLLWKFNHIAMDGTSLAIWMQVFAEECRRVQGIPISEPIQLEEMYGSRELVMKGSSEGSSHIEDSPSFQLWPSSKPPPSQILEPDWSVAVYYLSKSSQKALKALASPLNATLKTEQSWISTNDAIAALMWRVSIQVQGLPTSTEEQSEICFAVDGRRKLDMEIHATEMGCFLQPASALAPLGKVYDESLTLADLALLVRQAVTSALYKTSLQNLLAAAQKLRDEGQKYSMVYSALPKIPKSGVMLTSWSEWNVRDYDWGPLLGKIQGVRVPNTGYLNGTHIVFPRLPDGGVELFFCLPKDQIKALEKNDLLKRYAHRR